MGEVRTGMISAALLAASALSANSAFADKHCEVLSDADTFLKMNACYEIDKNPNNPMQKFLGSYPTKGLVLGRVYTKGNNAATLRTTWLFNQARDGVVVEADEPLDSTVYPSRLKIKALFHDAHFGNIHDARFVKSDNYSQIPAELQRHGKLREYIEKNKSKILFYAKGEKEGQFYALLHDENQPFAALFFATEDKKTGEELIYDLGAYTLPKSDNASNH